MQEKIELINGKFIVKGGKEKVEPPKKEREIKQYSKEALELRDRVIKGNQKLFNAWQEICKIAHDSQRWDAEMERWSQATKKLLILCSNLQGLGYVDCLYFDENGKRSRNCLSNPDGFWCQACPSEYPYWEKDAGKLLFNNKEEK